MGDCEGIGVICCACLCTEEACELYCKGLKCIGTSIGKAGSVLVRWFTCGQIKFKKGKVKCNRCMICGKKIKLQPPKEDTDGSKSRALHEIGDRVRVLISDDAVAVVKAHTNVEQKGGYWTWMYTVQYDNGNEGTVEEADLRKAGGATVATALPYKSKPKPVLPNRHRNQIETKTEKVPLYYKSYDGEYYEVYDLDKQIVDMRGFPKVNFYYNKGEETCKSRKPLSLADLVPDRSYTDIVFHKSDFRIGQEVRFLRTSFYREKYDLTDIAKGMRIKEDSWARGVVVHKQSNDLDAHKVWIQCLDDVGGEPLQVGVNEIRVRADDVKTRLKPEDEVEVFYTKDCKWYKATYICKAKAGEEYNQRLRRWITFEDTSDYRWITFEDTPDSKSRVRIRNIREPAQSITTLYGVEEQKDDIQAAARMVREALKKKHGNRRLMDSSPTFGVGVGSLAVCGIAIFGYVAYRIHRFWTAKRKPTTTEHDGQPRPSTLV